MKAYERLLKYAVIKTPSDESSDSTPSSACQFDLANLLKKEMEELEVSDIQLTDNCFLYGKLPATKGYESAPAIGFIAHMDTVADYCEQPIRPIITENYNGKELALGNSGLTLSPKMFPHLESLKGHTLITTDGNTILGADDKAGIAEIMTLVEHLQKESIPHGPISIAFTPDEEIGTGASHFDVELFGITIARPGYLSPWYMYGAITVALPGWAVGTALGALAGNLMPWRLVSAFSVALYGMFLAIIIPPARKSRILAGLIAISFAASYLAEHLPGISSISSGTRTIILTVVLSSAAAILFPHPAEDSAADTSKETAEETHVHSADAAKQGA